MEIRLPPDKLSRMREMLKAWHPGKEATKWEILPLVGTLQHATNVVRPNKTFVSWMYLTTTKLKKLHFVTTLNEAFQSALFWWHIFYSSWKASASCIILLSWQLQTLYIAQTDASGVWRCVAVLGSWWLISCLHGIMGYSKTYHP